MSRWLALTSACTCGCLTLSLRGCQCGEVAPARLPLLVAGDEYRVRTADREEQDATYNGVYWLDADGCTVDAVAIEVTR